MDQVPVVAVHLEDSAPGPGAPAQDQVQELADLARALEPVAQELGARVQALALALEQVAGPALAYQAAVLGRVLARAGQGYLAGAGRQSALADQEQFPGPRGLWQILGPHPGHYQELIHRLQAADPVETSRQVALAHLARAQVPLADQVQGWYQQARQELAAQELANLARQSARQSAARAARAPGAAGLGAAQRHQWEAALARQAQAHPGPVAHPGRARQEPGRQARAQELVRARPGHQARAARRP